ncbi:hypothetical protein Lser_V15G25697 [Lactuca serriola]
MHAYCTCAEVSRLLSHMVMFTASGFINSFYKIFLVNSINPNLSHNQETLTFLSIAWEKADRVSDFLIAARFLSCLGYCYPGQLTSLRLKQIDRLHLLLFVFLSSETKVQQVLVPINIHLARTHCALAILKIIGNDFSLINSSSILKPMKCLQQFDGCLVPIHIGEKIDLQFVYCNGVISSMFDDWSGMDKEKAKKCVLSFQ